MKSQLSGSFARASAMVLASLVFLALAIFLIQCLYWLSFGTWFDWTSTRGSMFPNNLSLSGHWKGFETIIDMLMLAPIQLACFVTGVILAFVYVWVRISSGK